MKEYELQKMSTLKKESDVPIVFETHPPKSQNDVITTSFYNLVNKNIKSYTIIIL